MISRVFMSKTLQMKLHKDESWNLKLWDCEIVKLWNCKIVKFTSSRCILQWLSSCLSLSKRALGPQIRHWNTKSFLWGTFCPCSKTRWTIAILTSPWNTILHCLHVKLMIFLGIEIIFFRNKSISLLVLLNSLEWLQRTWSMTLAA